MTPQTPAQDWAWMQQHAGLTALITVAAALALYTLYRAVRAATKRLHLDTALRAVATPGTLIWEAQGTYVLARGMGMPVEIALAGCTITSTAVIVLAHQAHRHFRKHGTLGPAGRYTWYVAAPMGLAVALTQHTIAYGFARVVVPLMAVLLWYSQYAPDEPAGERHKRKRGRWIWTPERALVAAGLLAPTAEDLAESNATLRVRKLKRHAAGLWHGPAWLRAWHGYRLRRLAETSTDEEVAAAQRSNTRVHTIEAATAPSAAGLERTPLRSGWWLWPWSAARRSTLHAEALRLERDALERSARQVERTAAQAVEQATAALREAHADAERRITALVADVERQRLEHSAEINRMLAERDVERARLIAQHAEALAAERSNRTPWSPPERSSGAGGRGRGGGPERPDGVGARVALLSDEGAIAAMLEAHDEPNFAWTQGEVRRVTGAGVTRANRLLGLIAEHHARAAQQLLADEAAM